ncbi:hypothetical protein BH09BAC3_BH09BAC3_35880 [soil metagenome]
MIGTKIKELRKLKNWTVRELAKRASITANMVSTYEREEGVPKQKVIEKLAKAFNVPVDVLITENKEAQSQERTPELKYIFKEKLIKAANEIVSSKAQSSLIDVIDRYLITEAENSRG